MYLKTNISDLAKRTLLFHFLCVLVLLFISCAVPFGPYISPEYVSQKQERIEIYARSFLGTPYRYGGSNKYGMDCSGLVMRVYLDACRISLPHSTRELYKKGRSVSPRALQTGDLVFFRINPGRIPSHVGMYLQKGEFIHASSSRGVVISKLSKPYYTKRFAAAKRILPK